MTFEDALAARSSADYAEFLLPHLAPEFHLLDVGCGSGALSIGLAGTVAHVTGVDPAEDFAEARQYAATHGLDHVEFLTGNVYALDLPDDSFDACLCHSVLEVVDRPLDGLREIRRVLKPGGVLGVACVEYGGLVLAGPKHQLLRRFYAIRERLWQLNSPAADPYLGRELRGLLNNAGFAHVVASTKYMSYGTDAGVKSFGLGRAEDCRADWYASSAQRHGLADESDLAAMEDAWLEWSESPDAYAAFAWCRAIGWKPPTDAGRRQRPVVGSAFGSPSAKCQPSAEPPRLS